MCPPNCIGYSPVSNAPARRRRRRRSDEHRYAGPPSPTKDACIGLNPHVGGNPATAQEARKAVSEFLQALLKLGEWRWNPPA